MILRKPYAFLIKYFKRINILLLALVAFIFYKHMELYEFINNYLNTGYYNSTINSISNYINTYTSLAFISIIVISVILAYLLRRKDKPYISYIYVLIANLLVFILFLYTKNYFTFNVINGYDLVSTKVIKDLFFIASLPFYPMLLILLIRSIGIDLKSFGFGEDKEFIEINEEDREEVEVEVAFNKDKLIRRFKYRIRYLKYFILEHKVPLLIVFTIILSTFGYSFYNYYYVENRIYTMNEVFKSNYYNISVKNSYLTDKDYAGNIVSEEGTYFILVDVNINNMLNYSRDFDIKKMLLFVDNNYYLPTTRFNEYFQDMGNLYINKSIKANQNVSYLLVYEVPKPKNGSSIVLKYQDATTKTGKLIRVKVKVLDISTFKEKGSSNLGNSFTVPLNLDKKVTFNLSKYELLNSINYTYQQCGPNSCPIYENTVTVNDKHKILYLKGNYGNYSTKEFISFLKKYGKIIYTKDGQTYEKDIEFAVNKNYLGNHLYLLISNEIAEAHSIKLAFTVRTYRYYYVIK